ncbi:MAG: type IX secretion system sortase PorU, partial [Bacteroidia bacterium]|nr:type IX secretion system sortase PorU [Bacteroidia bacterium]
DGYQLLFRNFSAVGMGNIAEYNLGNYSPAYSVWDITYPTNAAQVNGQVNGNFLIFKSANDSIREFISFHKNTGFLKPVFSKKIINQNLHALPQADYLIVTHPKFLQQANELAALHKEVDSLSINVVTTEQVYNEFSSGMCDATAIKDFVKMFYDRATSPNELPKYLLLYGDGSYDNKNGAPSNTNFIPTYQSENSLKPTESYVSEDYFGLLDDSEGDAITDVLDIGIGRLPVKNVSEAQGVLNKLKTYLKPTSSQNAVNTGPSCCAESSSINNGLGDWRNTICFIADDQDGAVHASQADAIATLVDTNFKVINLEKIYIDAYKQEVSAGGQRYPDVNDAINRRMERGALIINYTGHGGETGWAEERILDVPMIQSWTNVNTLPLFVTATCEFSRFDDPGRTSAGEMVLLNDKGGGIGLLTTTRLVYSNPNYVLNVNFFNHVFDTLSNGKMARLGDIIRLTKKSSAASVNNRNFTLLGDPAIRLAYPRNKVYTNAINHIAITNFTDTVKGLSKVTVTGYVGDNNGVKKSDFNGVLFPTVFDKKAIYSTLSNDGPAISPRMDFKLQKNVVYRGRVSVVNGDFEFSFIVPKDIAYNIDYGKISYYAENGKTDANGFEKRFLIGGFNDKAPPDNTGPNIGLFMNDEKFISGGLTNTTPSIFAKLFDENGINTVGNGIGHDLTAVLDANTEKTIVLNDYYQAETNSYQKGNVRYKLNNLSEGKHTVKFKAWDVYNNSNETTIDFIVAKDEKLALSHVLNYPNPFTTHTQFFFEHNKPCSYLAITIQVFTVSGKLIKTIETNMFNNSYRSEGIEWNGRDDFGDKLARGVYIYKINVRASDGSYADKIEKLVILQ